MAKVPGVAPWGMTIDALLARADGGLAPPQSHLPPSPRYTVGARGGHVRPIRGACIGSDRDRGMQDTVRPLSGLRRKGGRAHPPFLALYPCTPQPVHPPKGKGDRGKGQGRLLCLDIQRHSGGGPPLSRDYPLPSPCSVRGRGWGETGRGRKWGDIGCTEPQITPNRSAPGRTSGNPSPRSRPT